MRRLLPAMLLLLAATGCVAPPPRADGPPRIVATYSVLGDLVKNVAGGRAEVTTLVGPDGDAHTFEPTPKDGVALASADVVFANGVGFEGWLDKLYASSGSRAERVVVSEGLTLREGECTHAHKPGEKHDHKHEDDPHLWHEVGNAVHMVGRIRDALVRIDPAGADQYKANAAAYLETLKKLDAWVAAKVAELPKDDRRLVTGHDTFGYFADRHGFDVVGTVLGSFSTEAADPSPAAFAKLASRVRATKVRAIFAENVHNPKLVERLAAEAGVRVGPGLYTDALGKPGSAGDTYEKMIRHNVTAIVDALKP